MAKKRKNNSSQGFEFIKDAQLRKNIKGSIEYMYLLYGRAQKEKDKDFKIETYRVIVLYAASVVEAVFLYAYKQHDKPITRIDYKFTARLGSGFIHKELPDEPVVIAVQTQRAERDQEITFDNLIEFFETEKLMAPRLLKKIKVIKDIRNTFHLSKSRSGVQCNIKSVEASFKILVAVFNGVRSMLVV